MTHLKWTLAAWVALTSSTATWSQNTTRELNIEQLFTLVEQNSKNLKAQRTNELMADQGISVAKSQKLPDIGVSFSTSYIGNALMTNRNFGEAQGLHSPHSGNNFSLEARQTVYAGGALDAGVRIAKLSAEQANVGAEQSRQQERFMALGQYLDMAKIDNRIKVVEGNIALTKKLIDDINERHEQGMALKNDVTRYELQMQNLQLDLTKLRDSRTILNHQLCNTLAINNGNIVTTENLTAAQYGQEGENIWQTTAAMEAPSLKLAQINEQIATQNVKIARSEMLPKVSIVAVDNFDGPITYELPPIDKNMNVWYVGIGINYSLSSLYKSNKRLQQAHTATQLSQEQHAIITEQVNNQMQQAYTGYEQSYVELTTQQKKVELARQNYQVVNDRYLNQLALITDMIDASNVKLDAELSEVDALINVAYAYYKVKFIAGKI